MPLKLQSDGRRCLGVASAHRVSRQGNKPRVWVGEDLDEPPFVSNSVVVRLHPPALVLRNLAFAEVAGGERQ